MLTSWYAVGIVLALGLFPGRGEAHEPPGEKAFLNMEVHVLRSDGSPAINEPIVTAEMMAGLVVTGVGTTDERGVFKLRGEYCLPMIVSTEKGGAKIGVGGTKEISIQMKEPGVSFERLYGKIHLPDPDKLQRWRRECTHYDFPDGELIYISAEVFVVDKDRVPAENQKVFIAERVNGELSTITGSIITDQMGRAYISRAYIRGKYCAPVAIAAYDNYIVLGKNSKAGEKYVITINDKHKHPYDIFGAPSNFIVSNIERLRKNCR
jgi:hypothetical protein